MIAAALLKLDPVEVGEAFQGILGDYSLDDGDTLAVEGMFLLGDSMIVGDIAAVGLGMDMKVQSLQMEYPYIAYSHILSYAIQKVHAALYNRNYETEL